MSDAAETSIAVHLVNGRARATVLDGGQHLRPRLLEIENEHVRIALVAVCATLLAGDHVRLNIAVESGVTLELLEPSGTVAYDARGGHASWNAVVDVAADAALAWRGAPFVVAGGADVTRNTTVHLAEGAKALIAETAVLGRSGEEGGKLAMRANYADRELLVEQLDMRSPQLRSMPGMLGSARVLATTALLGVDEYKPSSPYETRLHGPGALSRAVTRHAHEAETVLDDTWSRWRQHIGTPAPTPVTSRR